MSEFKKDNNYQKDNQSMGLVYDPIAFKGDYDIYILYRRVENVVAALFLVTNELPDTEIMKLSLRESCLKCLNDSVSFIASLKSEQHLLQILSAHVLELGSYLSMAYWSGIVSEMNSNVLQREISKVKDLISKVSSRYASKMVIDTTLFADIDLQMKHHQAAVAASQGFGSNRNTGVRESVVPTYDKKVSRPDVTVQQRSQHTVESQDNSPVKKSERREAILALLRQQNNLSIKDFLAVVKDYSEKTIQRELLTLVEEGLIKKEGERRWSTYSLPQ
ncbi:MAG: DeoR family transcriptional regulator [Patescibacteria group bacterium]